MELPRGSFHSMHKEIRLHSLLQELKRIRFTGHISISSSRGESAIVVRDGSCILANSGNRIGTRAWEEIAGKNDERVSAVLSELTSTQVGLAIEFNPKAMVDTESIPDSGQDTNRAEKPDTKKQAVPADETPREPVPPSPREGIYFQRKARLSDLKHHATPPGETTETVDRDLDRLDQMDLDTLTRNVKKHSTELIKGLNLEYLLEHGET